MTFSYIFDELTLHVTIAEGLTTDEPQAQKSQQGQTI